MTGRRVAAIVILITLMAGAGTIIAKSKTSTTTGGIHVIAAENFWGDIAQQLGTPYAHVTSIITDPNADPHLYESSAKDAADISSANIVIINGLGYDDFVNKLVSAGSHTNRQIITVQQILHATQGTNQHLWYDIPRIHIVAAQITAAYIAKDPSHTNAYQHNLAIFDQSLQPLIQTIQQIKRLYGGTSVAYTEPVPGYLLSDAGLIVQTPEGFAKSIEDGNDPSPADTNTMGTLVTNGTVKVLLYNAQATSPVTDHIKQLATQAGVPVIGVTETLPGAENYQTWQAGQLQALQHALSTTK